MRSIMIIILLFAFSYTIYAQEKSETKGYFVALYTLGQNWNSEKSANEQPYFEKHSAHLSKLRADSIIVVGARYSDTGMIVLKAKDLASAKNMILNDVAVENHLFNVEIHAFNPFYKGCLE